MTLNNVIILDCTLRDGGYINDWNWGFQTVKQIIMSLVKAQVDVVEVGFLRNIEEYNPDITVCNKIEELNRLVPANVANTMFSAMAMRSNYDIDKLSPYSGSGIEMIRITAHDYDLEEGLDFAKEVKTKGYKLSINPINIMGYSDSRILWIIEEINKIHPYQFTIVDTFGSMKRRDLDRIVSLVDNNLDRNIRVALHLHENMSLSCSLAQQFVDKHLNRSTAIDGSLMGMGRTPGNLPIELIADYLNEYSDKTYDIDYMMDAIQDFIAPIKGASEWGYTPAYFLSARFNLHRNYAEHFLKKGDLTNKDINHILARLEEAKKTIFDKNYADRLYLEYQENKINDLKDKERLRMRIQGKKICILAPGSSISKYKKEIKGFIDFENPTIISTNFISDDYDIDYAFFSNNKRYSLIEKFPCEVIITSNLAKMGKRGDYCFDYNNLSIAFNQSCNSFIMLLKLLKEMNVGNIYVAGADGYLVDKNNYYTNTMQYYKQYNKDFNSDVREAIRMLDIDISFITPSEYDLEKKNVIC